MPHRVVASAGAFSNRFSFGRPGRALGSGLVDTYWHQTHKSIHMVALRFVLRSFAASMNTSARKYDWCPPTAKRARASRYSSASILAPFVSSNCYGLHASNEKYGTPALARKSRSPLAHNAYREKYLISPLPRWSSGSMSSSSRASDHATFAAHFPAEFK